MPTSSTSFLGRKLSGNFKGELVSVLHEYQLKGRPPGRRVKHRMKANWIKMYDKAGVVLRVETVINSPEEFRVRRRVHRNDKRVTRWVPLSKGVGFLFRYRDISRKSNQRYLDALAPVDDPTPALQQLDALTSRRRAPSGRSAKPFNPLARNDRTLFRTLLAGGHFIHGFTNRELREKLRDHGFPLHPEVPRQTGQVCASSRASTPIGWWPRSLVPSGRSGFSGPRRSGFPARPFVHSSGAAMTRSCP